MLIFFFTFGTEIKVGTDEAFVADTFNRLHATTIASHTMMNISSSRFFEFEERMRSRMDLLLLTERAEIKIGANCALVAVTRNGNHSTAVTFDVKVDRCSFLVMTLGFFIRNTSFLACFLITTTAKFKWKSLTTEDRF
jgi:hypothetical protein